MGVQVTPRELQHALLWIHTQPHHITGVEEFEKYKVVYFKNHHATLRVRSDRQWFKAFLTYTAPNHRPHDDRMYRLTFRGKQAFRRMCKKSGLEVNWKEHP